MDVAAGSAADTPADIAVDIAVDIAAAIHTAVDVAADTAADTAEDVTPDIATDIAVQITVDMSVAVRGNIRGLPWQATSCRAAVPVERRDLPGTCPPLLEYSMFSHQYWYCCKLPYLAVSHRNPVTDTEIIFGKFY